MQNDVKYIIVQTKSNVNFPKHRAKIAKIPGYLNSVDVFTGTCANTVVKKLLTRVAVFKTSAQTSAPVPHPLLKNHCRLRDHNSCVSALHGGRLGHDWLRVPWLGGRVPWLGGRVPLLGRRVSLLRWGLLHTVRRGGCSPLSLAHVVISNARFLRHVPRLTHLSNG